MDAQKFKYWLRTTSSKVLTDLRPKIQKANAFFHDLAVLRDKSRQDFKSDIPEDENPVILDNIKDSDLKKAILDLLKERKKLYEEQTERSEQSAETYLWLANAGFAAAIVTLESKSSDILSSLNFKFSLSFFLISISIIGWIKAYRIVRNYRLRGQFRKYYVDFITNKISFQELLNLDLNVSREPKALIYPAWLCYILFFLGTVLSIWGVVTR